MKALFKWEEQVKHHISTKAVVLEEGRNCVAQYTVPDCTVSTMFCIANICKDAHTATIPPPPAVY